MPEQDLKMKEAIAFFEQMLQSMPGDRTSLEFLSVAYDQTGQTEKRRECLIRLSEALLAEKDYDHAQVIAGYLSSYIDFPAARAAVERVAEVIQGQILESELRRDAKGFRTREPGAGQPLPAAFQDTGVEVHALCRSASAAEMDLVWLWKEREFLPKELCMDVLHILTDRPAADTPTLISALALLDEQHPELTDRLMEAMQRASEMPLVPLELFEVSAEAAALLGGEALVAVLNPLNAALREETVARAGRPCHFFFAHPRAWLKAAAKIT